MDDKLIDLIALDLLLPDFEIVISVDVSISEGYIPYGYVAATVTHKEPPISIKHHAIRVNIVKNSTYALCRLHLSIDHSSPREFVGVYNEFKRLIIKLFLLIDPYGPIPFNVGFFHDTEFDEAIIRIGSTLTIQVDQP